MPPENPYQSPLSEEGSGEGFPYDANPPSFLATLFAIYGRVPRRIYWAVTVGALVALIAAGVALDLVFGPESDIAIYGFEILHLPALWVVLAATIKRWHDRGRSAWWVLIAFLPLIGPLWAFIETGCLRGTVGANPYGPDPT